MASGQDFSRLWDLGMKYWRIMDCAALLACNEQVLTGSHMLVFILVLNVSQTVECLRLSLLLLWLQNAIETQKAFLSTTAAAVRLEAYITLQESERLGDNFGSYLYMYLTLGGAILVSERLQTSHSP